MDIDTFVEKSLKSPPSYFRYLLESIVDSFVQKVRDHLKQVDILEEENSAIEETAKVLADLRKPDTTLWADLLGIELPGSNRYKQLSIIQDKLQTILNRLNIEINTLEKDIEKINQVLDYLVNLKVKFETHKKHYSNEIDDKIVLLEGYELSLKLRYTALLERKKIYNLLLLKLE